MKLFKSIIFSILLLSTAYSQEAVDTSIPEVIIEVPEIIPNLNITQSGEYPEFLTLRGDFQRLKRKTGNGKGVKVGVVDTGLDPIHAQKGRDLELYDGSNPDTYRVREVKDFTGSRIQPHWGDRSSHGCIHGDDMIFNSRNGIQPIKQLFEEANRLNLPRVLGQAEGSDVIDITSLGVDTLSLEKSNGEIERNQITHVHKLPFSGEVYKVAVGNEILTLTPWHPIYVQTSSRGSDRSIKKIRADELKVGDKVCKVHGKHDLSSEYITIPLESTYTCDNCNKSYKQDNNRCKSCNKTSGRTEHTHSIKLDEDFAFLIGLILTDGYLGKDCVEFTSDRDEHIEMFQELHKTCFGSACKEYATPSNARRIRSHNYQLRKALQYLGYHPGAKSHTVNVCKEIQISPRSVIFSFLAGCIEGDGCVSCNKVRLITASDDFKNDITNLYNSIGLNNSNSLIESIGYGFGDSRTWHIHFSASEELNSYMKYKKFRPAKKAVKRVCYIKDITTQVYEGYLYDLTVANNHNYVANGFIVSNTHVAGHIGAAANGRGIEGIASDCDLYIAKGLGDKGFGSDTQISRAINWLISKDVDIINLSLGGGFSQRIENAVLKARRAGIIVFAAIGNNGNMGDGHPGNSGHTLGIAAVNYQFELASFSSRSNRALMSGFGVNVYSCMKGGSYGALSGTSMATPDQVGIAALIIGYLRLNGIEIKDTLDYWTLVKRSIIDLGPKGLDRGYGYGFLDVWKVIDHIDRNILPERPTNPRPPPTSPTPPKEPPTNPPVNPYQGYEKVGGINTEQWGDYIILKRKSKESKTIKRLPANRIEDLILPVIDTIKPCPIETGG